MITSRRVAVIDTETTGLDPEQDRIVDVVIREIDDNLETVEVFYWRVNPCRPITTDLVAIHGISDEMVIDCPTFGEIADDVAKILSSIDVVIGYKPDYDLEFLRAELQRAVVKFTIPSVVICSLRLWNIHEPPPKRHLQAAYMRFVDESGFEGAHDAVADTKATLDVLVAQMKEFGLTTDWETLDPERATWVGASNHAVWQTSDRQCIKINFGKHTGKTACELDAGYCRYVIEKDFPTHLKKLFSYVRDYNQRFHRMDLEARNFGVALWARENL